LSNRIPKLATTDTHLVGDYTLFLSSWDKPNGGIHGYLSRFLTSGDATFQHIAIWTLLQLLESNDSKLIQTINSSSDVIAAVRRISERLADVPQDEIDDSEDGEGEIVTLAKRCLEIAIVGSAGGIAPNSGELEEPKRGARAESTTLAASNGSSAQRT
jgi:vacuolar protein 8